MDFDGKMKSVVYFGNMFDGARYYYIERKYITDEYSLEELKKRRSEIGKSLYFEAFSEKRLALIEERGLIDSEISSRLEDYISTNKLTGKKVFLSHSSYDKSIVISVALDLKAKGISTWVDSFDILPGESIISRINYGLNECDYVLLFLSKNSVKSNWVTKEWESILWDELNSGKVKIIPIKLDDCEIPKILQSKKYINLEYNYELGLNELIDTLKKYDERDSNSRI